MHLNVEAVDALTARGRHGTLNFHDSDLPDDVLYEDAQRWVLLRAHLWHEERSELKIL
jgi:hypothetical protein